MCVMENGRVGFLNIARSMVLYIRLLFVVTTLYIYTSRSICLDYFIFFLLSIQQNKKKSFYKFSSYQHWKKKKRKGKVEWFRNRLSCKIGVVFFFFFFYFFHFVFFYTFFSFIPFLNNLFREPIQREPGIYI